MDSYTSPPAKRSGCGFGMQTANNDNMTFTKRRNSSACCGCITLQLSSDAVLVRHLLRISCIVVLGSVPGEGAVTMAHTSLVSPYFARLDSRPLSNGTCGSRQANPESV